MSKLFNVRVSIRSTHECVEYTVVAAHDSMSAKRKVWYDLTHDEQEYRLSELDLNLYILEATEVPY